MSLIRPVFETVWKRKETKIFLAIAIIFPLIFLASTFLPKESNFLVPRVSGGFRFTFMELSTALFTSASDMTLPTLALFLLSFSVFRSEADTHLLFLYKDLCRKDVFWAKVISLILVVFIYTLIFYGIMVAIFYSRVAYMPYASTQFLTTDAIDIVSVLSGIWTFLLESSIGLLLAACLSLYAGKGATLTTAFAYSLGSTIIVAIGGPLAKLFPSDYFNWDTYNGDWLAVLGGAGLVSLIYCAILSYLTLKRFKSIEF